MATAGQIVEASVKHHLLNCGHNDSDINRKTLGQLMHLGRQDGSLQSQPSGLGDASLSAALILRNWSSHYAASARDPDAIQAAQALALTIATAETLFPRTPQSEPTDGNVEGAPPSHQTSNPGVRVARLEQLSGLELRAELRVVADALADEVARFGAPSTIARFEVVLRKSREPLNSLRDSLDAHFPAVVRNASRSSFRKLMDLLLALRRLELNTHATVLGILLPADPLFLADLVRSRAPAYVATYFAECFKANRSALSSRVGDPKKRAVFVNAFWNKFGPGTGNVINAANILAKLPPYIRAELLKQAPRETLLSWIASSDPLDSANLLSSLGPLITSGDAGLEELCDRAVDAIAASVATAPVASLSALPLRLRRVKATDAVRSHKILTAALSRVGSLGNSAATRRVVWDTYSFFPELEGAAIEAGRAALENASPEVELWDRICLTGMLVVAGAPLPAARPEAVEDGCLELVSNPSIDRWQRFLHLVGFVEVVRPGLLWRVSSQTCDDLQRLLSETTNTDNQASTRLLEAARTALSQLRQATASD
jgi:hypothetical protein